MKFTPLFDEVLVLDIPVEREIGGVLLPDSSKESVFFSRVVALGEGYVQDDGSLRPLRLKTGDTIVRGMYSGISMVLEGTEFFLIKEGECLGRIET